LPAFHVENIGTSDDIESERPRCEFEAAKLGLPVKVNRRGVRFAPKRQVAVDFVQDRAAAVGDKLIFVGALGRMRRNQDGRIAGQRRQRTEAPHEFARLDVVVNHAAKVSAKISEKFSICDMLASFAKTSSGLVRTSRMMNLPARSIGPAAAEAALPALVAALKDPDKKVVAEHAAEALGKIGPSAAEAAPALVAALEDPYEGVRLRAAEALGKMPTRQRYSPPSKTPTTKFGDAPKKCSIAFVERGGAVSLAIRLQGLLPAVGGYLSDNVHLILLVRYNFAKRIDL